MEHDRQIESYKGRESTVKENIEWIEDSRLNQCGMWYTGSFIWIPQGQPAGKVSTARKSSRRQVLKYTIARSREKLTSCSGPKTDSDENEKRNYPEEPS